MPPKRKITVDEIPAILQNITATARRGDYELAHVMEDTLWERVLYTIGIAPTSAWEDHGRASRALSREALKSREISFRRSCM